MPKKGKTIGGGSVYGLAGFGCLSQLAGGIVMADPIIRPDSWVIQPVMPLPNGGDVHETFRINPKGDPEGGHTTVRVPGGDTVHLPWDNGK